MKSLPPASAFYNKLKKEDIDPKDYESLQALWNKLGFCKLRDLASLYLSLDILLLGKTD